MNEFFIAIILAGTFLLLASLVNTLRICRKTSRAAWYILFYFIVLFIAGYLGILYYFISYPLDSMLVSIVACILFGGGAFVFLVIRLSFASLLKVEKAVEVQRYQAEHDALTGLPNRKMFFGILSKTIEAKTPCTVLFIDLNDFKQVNDSFGHHFGDQLLIATAQGIQSHLSNYASLYRLGGDEFAVLSTFQHANGLQQCIELITRAANSPVEIDEQFINVRLSIGVSHFPQDSEDMHELVRLADLAMYEAKNNNQTLVFYHDKLSQKESNFLLMTNRIQTAIEQGEFMLFYQPIVCAKSGEEHGLEALIRWPQPDGSYLSPEYFIKIAERSTLILSLTKWVIIEALNNLSNLYEAGFKGMLHINLSAQDLKSNEFFKYICSLHEQDPSISNTIIFEITESAMMTDIKDAREMILALNKKGFQFSIDDFGTGFSSLSLLRELPITQIKIDRSFVNDMLTQKADYAIVNSIIFLAEQLSCSVVAEGVESHQIEQALISLNCDFVQGFYYSRPLPIESLSMNINHFKKAIN
ncbi:putative bifunctional diguanylate cyclase/phosphodiesterase [Psychromonas sp. GE-S-Ul-11]|uniref:putative bifunctional diguanylate cyclase/phosphodiesterase n=1 Tax=Psychromonas sp. GE-S-Ul-11 TaxID=3241170 RepID=UPI00390C5DBE